MREEIEGLVALKVRPLRRHDGLSAKHRIQGYPTVVVLRPDGREVGRIVGFKPPGEFLGQIREMRHGRTLEERIADLRLGGNAHAMLPAAIDGLRERGDLPGALALHREVHREERLDCCRGEEWFLELELQAQLYREAGAWATMQRDAPPEVPAETSVTMLASLLGGGPIPAGEEGLHRRLREARRIDTSILGARIPLSQLPADVLKRCGERLYGGGDYEGAARLWMHAAEVGIDWDWSEYGLAAARFLDADTRIETAEAWARRAVRGALQEGQPAILEQILLARVEARLGRHEEAVATARQAARAAIARGRLAHANEASRIARRCAQGKPIGSWEPPFERWPG